MWQVRYKLAKTSAWIETAIVEVNSDNAWRAWTCFRLVNGIDVYYTAEAFQTSVIDDLDLSTVTYSRL